VSAGLSLVVHIGVLGTIAAFHLRGGAPEALIRVVLLRAGLGGTAGAAESPAPPAATAAALGVTDSAGQPVAPRPRITRPRGARPAAHAPATTEPAVVAAPRPGDVIGGGTAAPASAREGSAGHGVGAAGNGTGNGDGTDQRAYCVYCPPPRYPLIARARGWEGTVHVALALLADGTVHDARVRQSSGYGPLDAAAVAVARLSRFSPLHQRGMRTPLRGRIEYQFRLTNE
jgi:TonB family protein